MSQPLYCLVESVTPGATPQHSATLTLAVAVDLGPGYLGFPSKLPHVGAEVRVTMGDDAWLRELVTAAEQLDALVEGLRQVHQRRYAHWAEPVEPPAYCSECRQTWPCATMALLEVTP